MVTPQLLKTLLSGFYRSIVGILSKYVDHIPTIVFDNLQNYPIFPNLDLCRNILPVSGSTI